MIIRKSLQIMMFIFFILFIVGCGSNQTSYSSDSISITDSNVLTYFNVHGEARESGYGIRYDVTVTPKVSMDNVNVSMNVLVYCKYTYRFSNSSYIYTGTQNVYVPVSLSLSGYGSGNSYKGTGAVDVVKISINVSVDNVSGSINKI